jgi:molybdate transport system substrate-binding protein
MHVLSGGAAAAVVKAVQAEFEKSTGTSIHGTFSAVGQMTSW